MRTCQRPLWTLPLALFAAAAAIIVPRACAADVPPPMINPAGAAPATAPAGPTGNRELAARFATLAQDTLRQKALLPPHFKQAAALIRTAALLDPDEPRYARMSYEAALQMGDNEAALRAVQAYRAISEQTANDQVAMIAFLDLSVRMMETAKDRADWLASKLAVTAPNPEKNYPGLAGPVRSHLAFRASQIARERGQSDFEDAMLKQSLELNPLNLDALKRRLEVVTADGNSIERVGIMLQMMRANPVQPALTYQLAKDCADAGINDEALRFYKLAANTAGATGTALGRDFAVNYAAELYLSDVPQVLNDVRTIAGTMLKSDPNDLEVHLLRWLALRAAKDKEELAKAQVQLINAALNRVIVLRGQLGVKEATTRPVDSKEPLTLPDLASDLKTLEDEKFAALRLPYAQAVADLAWYLVYVDNKSAESAQLLPTLKTLLTDAHPLVIRIEGWIAMAEGKDDQAKIKFQAAADHDELARLGQILLQSKNPADKEKVAADARELLTRNPAGVLAVMLTDALRSTGAKAAERGDAVGIRAKIAEFPIDFLRILETPAAFYVLRAEMLDRRVVFPYGEPMIASISIRNISKYPITIGPDGMIKSDLWFDAQFRGIVQQGVPGAAYERLSQVLVLEPGKTVTQIFRFDQGQSSPLGQVIANPLPTLTFYGYARTNPRGDGGSSLGGQGVQFTSISERSGFGLNQQGVQVMTNLLDTGKPDEKLRSLDLLVAVVAQLRSQPDQEKFKPIAAAFVELLEKKTADPVPGVSTWAHFLTAVNAPQRASEMMNKLLASPEPQRKLLGMLIATGLPVEPQKQLFTKLVAEDKTDVVQLYGTAALEIADIIAKARAEQTPGTGTTPTPAPLPAPAPRPAPEGGEAPAKPPAKTPMPTLTPETPVIPKR